LYTAFIMLRYDPSIPSFFMFFSFSFEVIYGLVKEWVGLAGTFQNKKLFLKNDELW
jgi:hypothetical protein